MCWGYLPLLHSEHLNTASDNHGHHFRHSLSMFEDLFSFCSYGTLLVRPNIGDLLMCETIDRLLLLFLWDFLGSIFSVPCIHWAQCLQHKHDCKIALPFIQELAGYKRELKAGSSRIFLLSLPRQYVKLESCSLIPVRSIEFSLFFNSFSFLFKNWEVCLCHMVCHD